SAGQSRRRAAPLQIRVSTLRRVLLWAFIACRCVAFIEPSPYEVMFPLVVLAFASGGLIFDRTIIPMVVTLAMFNAGGALSLVPWVGERESVTFVAISIYIAITAIFFAALIAQDSVARLRTI